MAAFEVMDPSWGSIFNDFAGAFDPAKRARAQLLGQSIAEKNMTNEQLRAILEAQRLGSGNAVANWDFQNPPGVVPTPADSPVKFEGPATPDMERQRVLDRDRLQASTQQGIYSAKGPKDVAQAYFGLPAINQLAAGGIPVDRSKRDVMETMLGTIGASMPGYDQAKMPLKTIGVYDENGKLQRTVISQSGDKDVYGRPITVGPNERAMLMNPAAAEVTNPFKDRPQQLVRLTELANKERAGTLTTDEMRQASLLRDELFPEHQTAEMKDGQPTGTLVRQRPIPPAFGPLSARIDSLYGQQPPPAPGAIAPPTGPAGGVPATTGAAPPPDATTGGLAGTPAVPAAPAPAAGQPPIAANRPSMQPLGPGDPTRIMKDLGEIKPVQTYQAAEGPYKSLLENIKINSPQADVAIIYAVAKILDPGSVVREGEMVIWNQTSSLTQRLDGYLSKALSGQASLTPEIRAGLAQAANAAIKGQYDTVAPYAEQFRVRARQQQLDPDAVVPIRPPQEPQYGAISKTPARAPLPVPGVVPRGAPGPTGAPAAAAPAAPTPRIDHDAVQKLIGG